MPDSAPILPRPAAWAASVEEVDAELRDALAGDIVRVRLTMDGVPSVMISDGRGGATQRKLWTSEDVAWLITEQREAAEKLVALMEARQARIASGEHAYRVAMIERNRALLYTQDAQYYLKNMIIPDLPLLAWSADESLKLVGRLGEKAWAAVSDPVWEFVLALQAAAERAAHKISSVAQTVWWVFVGGVAVWFVGSATRPFRK